jgi:hypothetical protein
MNFSSSRLYYFQNLGHTLLLLILVGQTSMLNEYFTWWDREVRRHSGTIDKYIGDVVMVN